MSNAHPAPPTPPAPPARPERTSGGSPPRRQDIGPTNIPPRGVGERELLMSARETRDFYGRSEWTTGRAQTSTGWVNFEWVDADRNWRVTVDTDPAIDVRVVGSYLDAQKYAAGLAGYVTARDVTRDRFVVAESELAAWLDLAVEGGTNG